MLNLFIEGFEKQAAARSELLSVLNPLNYVAAPVGGIAGLLRKPYSDDELKEVNKKSTSNMLVPGLGAYRFGRRMNGLGMSKEERAHKKDKK